VYDGLELPGASHHAGQVTAGDRRGTDRSGSSASAQAALMVANAGVALVAALGRVLVRQYLTLVDNRRLVEALATREAQLQQQAFHDPLTGLANRALFTERVQAALDRRDREGTMVSVLTCDLDDFKAVNDGLGHAAGDQLLALVARRLLGALRPSDVLARLGGDEFAVLLDDTDDPQAVGQRIAAALGQPFRLAETTVILRASVGAVTLDRQDPVGTVEDTLARADVAMYAAKRAGKGRFAVYTPGMTLPETRDLHLRGPLARALAAREVHAHLQPIVSLRDGSVIGYEALARWELDGVAVSPAEFVPVAARSGLMPRLTDLMLDAACREVARWVHGQDLALAFGSGRRPYVAVNVAPSELVDVRLPDRVRAALAAHEIPPQHLAIEITEDALLTDPATAQAVCASLVALGVRLSLDDFGTGYSSLAHLAALPLHTLKIDRGFVAEVDRDGGAERMARALVGLARDLGLELVAEGVERPGQAQVLRRLGCTYGQGYALGAPSAAELAPAPRTTMLELATPALGLPLLELGAFRHLAGGTR
jgi:diguanylate cyclase